MLKQQLKGTGVAIITPFTTKHKVDFEGLKNVMRHVIDGGVDYLVLLGTTGENATLDVEEKKDIIHFCNEQNHKQIPVVVGIGGNNTRQVVRHLSQLPLEKSVAVMSVSPYYNKPSQDGLFEHYKQLSQNSPQPLIIYNVPSRTSQNINLSTILRLSELDNIGGIKEAGDINQALQLIKYSPKDFLVTTGEDTLALPLMLSGIDGIVSVAANVFPRELSYIGQINKNKDVQLARQHFFNILEGIHLMFEENNPAGVKAFLSEMGIIQNYLRLPLVPLSKIIGQKVKSYIKLYNPIAN